MVDSSARQTIAVECRLAFQRFRCSQRGVPPRSAECHELVQEQSCAELESSDAGPPINRPGERERFDQVRGDSQQSLSLTNRLAHQMKLPVLEISDSAVYQARGTPRRTAREIVALDQRDSQPAHRCVPRDSAAGDPAPDHQQVEFFFRDSGHFAR